MEENKEPVKGYKGFEKGLICKGKQYAENTVFEEENAEICKSGMHFCQLPHSVFEYYSPGGNHEFAEVEALDEVQNDGSKSCTKKLKIGAKISVFKLCQISVPAFFEKFRFSDKIKKAKDSPAANAGYRGAANAGNCGAANAGDYGAANAGNYGAAIVRAEGQASVGEKGIAIAFGSGAKAKGKKGALLVLVETDDDQNIISKRAVIVDGDKIKENTFYTLKNNQLLKCESEEQE